MTETARLLETLKRVLRARGVTYRALAQRIGLSESSVKRLFSDQSFTLTRLSEVCAAIETSLADLVRMSAGSSEAQPRTLSIDQERTLASDPALLACFYLLLIGRTPAETAQSLGLSERALRPLLARLAKSGLVETGPGSKVRVLATAPVEWRVDGPVRRLYERQVREEFLRAPFTGRNEVLSFHTAELSPASVRVLLRKIERLAAHFADLAALDLSVPAREKTSLALLLGCRPWVFSMFSAYRARG